MSSLEKLSEMTAARYGGRYQDLGHHIRSLGWGSEEQQAYRFAQTLAGMEPREKTVLDIGCGFADYYRFLEESGHAPAGYTGWDITPEFVTDSRARLGDAPQVVIEERNFLEGDPAAEPVADIGVMLGLLNYNWKGAYDNVAYSRNAVTRAFFLVREVLVVDFLSSHLTESYPKEDFVYYHDPVEMLGFALELTPRVTLKQDYAPIPQREFMLFLYK